MSILADDIILYTETPKDFNKCSKVTGYKINIQNPLCSSTRTTNIRKENENNPIHTCNKKDKIARNKRKKECKGPVHWKSTRWCWKRTQRNVKIPHVPGLGELTLFKWPCCLKQATDLMQSASKSQWHFSKT